MNGVDKFWRDGLIYRENSPQHRAHLVIGKRSEDDFLCQMASVKLGQPALHVRGSFIAAVSQKQYDWLVGALPREMIEEFQTCVVAPMDVFDDQRKGALYSGTNEKLSQPVKKMLLLLLCICKCCLGCVR